jgi:hypothetical protein
MLDRLSGGDETGVEGVALLEIFHDGAGGCRCRVVLESR